MTDDTKPESASERDEETAFLKQFVKDYSHPEAMKIWQDGFDAGRQSMREEITKRGCSVELTCDGGIFECQKVDLEETLDRQEKTISELVKGLKEIRERADEIGMISIVEMADRGLARTENP